MALGLALVSLVGLAAYFLFQKLKLPGMLGMLLAGVLLGPYVLDFIHPDVLRASADFRKIALIIILLRAGFEMSRKTLARVGWTALLMSFIPATCELLGVVLLAPPMLGISVLESAMLGAILGSVSPAIVVPHMIDLQQRRVGTGKDIPALLIASSSVGNVYVIIVFTSLLEMAGGQHINLVWSFAGIPLSIVLGIAVGAVMGFALDQFFKKVNIRDTQKVILLVSIAILLTAVETALGSKVPFSGLLAIMVIGVVLLERYEDLVHRLSFKFEKIWVFAQLLLFVLVGTQVNLSVAWRAGLAGLAVIFGALVFRSVGVLLCLIGSGFNLREQAYCILANIPKATVQAAIGAVPLAAGVASGEVILAVAVLSILTTAPLGDWAMKVTEERWLAKEAFEPLEAESEDAF